jgi:hypothetical protein
MGPKDAVKEFVRFGRESGWDSLRNKLLRALGSKWDGLGKSQRTVLRGLIRFISSYSNSWSQEDEKIKAERYFDPPVAPKEAKVATLMERKRKRQSLALTHLRNMLVDGIVKAVRSFLSTTSLGLTFITPSHTSTVL